MGGPVGQNFGQRFGQSLGRNVSQSLFPDPLQQLTQELAQQRLEFGVTGEKRAEQATALDQQRFEAQETEAGRRETQRTQQLILGERQRQTTLSAQLEVEREKQRGRTDIAAQALSAFQRGGGKPSLEDLKASFRGQIPEKIRLGARKQIELEGAQATTDIEAKVAVSPAGKQLAVTKRAAAQEQSVRAGVLGDPRFKTPRGRERATQEALGQTISFDLKKTNEMIGLKVKEILDIPEQKITPEGFRTTINTILKDPDVLRAEGRIDTDKVRQVLETTYAFRLRQVPEEAPSETVGPLADLIRFFGKGTEGAGGATDIARIEDIL